MCPAPAASECLCDELCQQRVSEFVCCGCAAGSHARARSGGQGTHLHTVQQHTHLAGRAPAAGGLWLPHNIRQHGPEEAGSGIGLYDVSPWHGRSISTSWHDCVESMMQSSPGCKWYFEPSQLPAQVLKMCDCMYPLPVTTTQVCAAWPCRLSTPSRGTRPRRCSC